MDACLPRSQSLSSKTGRRKRLPVLWGEAWDRGYMLVLWLDTCYSINTQSGWRGSLCTTATWPPIHGTSSERCASRHTHSYLSLTVPSPSNTWPRALVSLLSSLTSKNCLFIQPLPPSLIPRPTHLASFLDCSHCTHLASSLDCSHCTHLS